VVDLYRGVSKILRRVELARRHVSTQLHQVGMQRKHGAKCSGVKRSERGARGKRAGQRCLELVPGACGEPWVREIASGGQHVLLETPEKEVCSLRWW
jgi:hypothetical protein